MRKHILLALGLLMLLLTNRTVYSQDNIVDEVIWVVGDDAILRSDVENTRLQMIYDNERITGDPHCVIPERLAIQKLYLHQAKLDSIDIPEGQLATYVDQEINRRISMVGSREKLEEYVRKPISAYRDEMKQSVKEMEMVRAVQQNLASGVKVTPVEVRNYYNTIPQDSLPFIPTTVEVQIITLEPKISLEEIDDIKRRLREFTDQVQSGEREFSTLARLYSEDTQTARYGGELGFVGKGTLVPEFAAVAFDLNDPKRISRIVETEYGYHIIQLIEKRGDRINVRHILLRPHVSKEELDEATQRLDSVRMDISDDKYSFDDAVTYISHDRDTRANKGLMIRKSERGFADETTSRFEMEQLPPEIAKAVSTMEVGEISQPFIWLNSKQKEVAAIVRLKSRTPGHKASITDDYQTLKGIVEMQKKQEVLEKWVKEKQQSTYIRINEKWRDCDFEMDGWVR